LRAGERGLFLAAVVLLGAYAGAELQARLYLAVEGPRLAALLAGEGSGPSGLPSAFVANGARKAARPGRAWGRLEVPRLGLEALVSEGVDEATLAVAVGHFPGSAFPGEAGNVALAAHRDTFFRDLGDARPGDLVEVSTPDGRFAYRIEALAVVASSRVDVIDTGREPRLTLLTCYPFTSVRWPSRRYVVSARPVEIPAGSASRGGAPAPPPPRG
jgi:sortase A